MVSGGGHTQLQETMSIVGVPIDTIGHAQGIGNDHSNTLIFQ